MKDSSKNKLDSKENSKPKWPINTGGFSLQAKKGIVLPLRYADKGLVRITCEKKVDLDWGSLPYESKISIKKAYGQGHVSVKAIESKKGEK